MRHSQDNIYSGTGITATEESDPIDMRQVIGMSVHGIWTKNSGTLTGGIKIQVSNEETPTNWVDLPEACQGFNNASGSWYYKDGSFVSSWMRIVVTIGAGAGDIDFNFYLSTKGC